MNILNIKNYIVKNSTGEILRFYLDSSNKIRYDLYDNNLELTEECLFSEDIVIAFSLDIDTRDRIHLIYICSDGNVYYNLYSNKKWVKKNLTKFDIRSNIYSGLSLRINKEFIHILYSFSNLINPKLWNIQHILGSKGSWEKTNVISFTSGKIIPNFFFDFDKFDNIHLIYTSIVENFGNINYTIFNSSSKKWNSVPKLLSNQQNNSSNPYILIDRFDNIHALWIVNKNNSFELKYKHLPILGSSKNIWKDETIPLTNYELKHPLIHEEKNRLKILIISKSKLFSLSSNDYGFTWNLDETIDIPTDIEIQNAKYLTNLSGEISTRKATHIIFCLNEKLILLGQEFIDYIYNYSSNDVDNDKGIIPEVDELIDTNIILDTLKNISNKINTLDDTYKNFATQLKDIGNALLIFKESLDTNNQNLIELQKISEELNSKTLRVGFWSKLIKRN